MPCYAMPCRQGAGQGKAVKTWRQCVCTQYFYSRCFLIPFSSARSLPPTPTYLRPTATATKQHPAFGLQDKLPRALPKQEKQKKNSCGSLSKAPPLGHCCIPIRGGAYDHARGKSNPACAGKNKKGQANNRLQHEATNSSLFWLSIPKIPFFPPLRRDGRPTMTLVASQQADDAGTITNLLDH